MSVLYNEGELVKAGSLLPALSLSLCRSNRCPLLGVAWLSLITPISLAGWVKVGLLPEAKQVASPLLPGRRAQVVVPTKVADEVRLAYRTGRFV